LLLHEEFRHLNSSCEQSFGSEEACVFEFFQT